MITYYKWRRSYPLGKEIRLNKRYSDTDISYSRTISRRRLLKIQKMYPISGYTDLKIVYK